ncbi:hypothetical protein PYCCODRAFT_1467843 [Trametes coccinea BRFM310]|uniref:Uncharacterized protein n=1 Tax=Trametes coccinea (strain BRFM310) TaxID=1353009 RepID=A0A1Y2IPE8_TRAC3|nr:hypothetical protein PYCCODRAFT_1467843 [Trametes coccinea BRFM310]
MLGSSHGKRTFEAVEGQQEPTAFKRRKPDEVAITQVGQADAQEGLPVSWDEMPVARKQIPTTIINGYPSISVKRSESESSRLNSPSVAHYEPVARASSASVVPPPGTPVPHGLRHNSFPDQRQHRATPRPTSRQSSSAGVSTPRMSHRSESRVSSRAQVDRLLREEYEIPDVPYQAGSQTPRIPTLDLRDAARSGQSGYRRDTGKSRPMGPPPIPGPPAPTRAPSRAHRHTPIPFGSTDYSSHYKLHSADMQPPRPSPAETVQVNGYNFSAIPPVPSSTSFEVPQAHQDNMAPCMPREQDRYGRPQHSHREERPFLRPAEWAQDELDGRFISLTGPAEYKCIAMLASPVFEHPRTRVPPR